MCTCVNRSLNGCQYFAKNFNYLKAIREGRSNKKIAATVLIHRLDLFFENKA